MQRLSTIITLAACFTGGLVAQQSITIPANAAGVEGSTANNFPWGFTSNTIAWGGLRIQAFYDTANLTSQGVNGPILITGLRWRTNGGNAPAGGQFAMNTIGLGASSVDYSAITTTYEPVTTVYSGPVDVIPSPASTPGAWYVDVQLQTPFPYDPSLGNDLIIDTDRPIMGTTNWTGAGSGSNDIAGAGSMASRIFASSNYPAANGTTQNHGVVVEIQFCEAGSYTQFGAGCANGGGVPDLAPAGAPNIGTTFSVNVTNVPATVAIMIIGLSNTNSANFGPLPFDGTSAGAPGCFLRVSDDATELLPAAGPTWNFVIPNDPAFCDVTFFNQALVFSPGVNAANWTISNAYEMVIGG